jgi:PAS domain S-box-containing protein
LNPVGWAYVGLFGFSGLVCFAAIPRAQKFEDPEIHRGLVWLLGTTGAWAAFKVAFFLAPDPFRGAAYTVGLVFGFATVWAWLYFCSAYTDRVYHRNRVVRWLSVGIFASVVSVKLTNPLHGLYFTTREATVPFEYLVIEHGILHWSVTGLSYVLAAVGMFMVFERYLESGYGARRLSVLTGLLGLPVALDVAALTTPQVIKVIYAPLGVAVFAIGVLFVFQQQFITVQTTTRGDDLSIYVDDGGRIRDYSRAVPGVFPELDDAVGEALSSAYPALAATIESDEQILTHETDDETRYYFVSTSGATFGDSNARTILLSDVTESERQRRALIERERELDEQNELYRAIIDTSFDFMSRLDPDGRFTHVSEPVEDFLGYTAEELDGEPITLVVPDGEAVERAHAHLEKILAGETIQVRDLPLETKAGTTVYADIRGTPVYDGSVPTDERTPDDIVSIQLMTHDATERRQREGLISVINRVLRHNLRNEMTVISGYAEMLESELDGDQAAKAEIIDSTANRLLDLSESAQLIEENRELSADLEPTDIVPVVEHLVTQLETQYPEASVSVEMPETAVAKTLPRIEIALWELVDNAAKHGGEEPSIDVGVTVDPTVVRVRIEDDGPGIPEIERSVLTSGEETQLVHGRGLGLWLVRWITTNLDGDVDTIETETGTTVEIRLPTPT